MIHVNALSENKKFLTISELKNMGYSYYKIGKLEDEGLISRVNRSTYWRRSPNSDDRASCAASSRGSHGAPEPARPSRNSMSPPLKR